MADSVGGAFPRNVNVGHVHVNNVDGFVYRYLGDVPTNPLNWVIIGGAANSDPSTVGWTTRQDGAQWFNKTTNIMRGWDGTQVVNIGAGGAGASSAQRWPFHFRGTEMSTAFGGGASAHFCAPAAGTITKWAFLIGGVALPENTIMQFYYDPFVAFTLVDSVTLLTGANNVKNERVISRAVNAGDVVLVSMANSYAPTVHTVILDGFVDFTPS